MRAFRWVTSIIALLAAVLAMTGCDDPSRARTSPAAAPIASIIPSPATAPDPPRDEATSVTLLVAASTSNAIDELVQHFTQRTGSTVRVSPGPSNGLAQQIIHGAPAHVFLSANARWSQSIIDQGLAARSVDLLGNALVLVVPRGNPAKIASPADLIGDRVKHVALAGENVPAGMYAQPALTAAGVYETLLNTGRIVRGQDVRVTLRYVERAEADAGVVYATDARASKQVEVAHVFDPAAYPQVVYPLVLLKAGADHPGATALFEYFQSDAAAGIWLGHGFTRLGTGPPR